MKKLSLFIALLLVIPATALALSIGGMGSAAAGSGLTQVATFENGTRYEAGAYPIIVLSGTYREMGRQYGALMKDKLAANYAFVYASFTDRGYTVSQMSEYARMGTDLQPKRMKEIREGMAETSGLTVEELEILYMEASVVLSAIYQAEPACSFMAVWGNYTKDGSVVLSRNYDMPDVISPCYPYYTLVVYNPTDGSNGVATFNPVGARTETLMNSAGLYISENNGAHAAGTMEIANRPDLIDEFFGMMLDYSDMKGLDAALMATRSDYAWIVNTASQDFAYSYEESVYDIKRLEGNGIIVSANHFDDPTWYIEGPPVVNSITRCQNLRHQAEEGRGSIDGERMIEIRNVLMRNGGATFLHDNVSGDMIYSTEHQVVYIPNIKTLWMKVVDRDWQKVELGPLFTV
ncbi:MAG: peptidase M1 [Methanoculleus sp.]|nr:peptidase M1 [Methanoculleus sp.]